MLHLINSQQTQPQKQIIKGDANDDGKVNARDVRLIQRRIQGYNDAIDMEAADIDNEITAVDMVKTNKMASDYENNFQTIRGDVNGDGEISIADVQAVDNYINRRSTSNEIYFKNEDCNSDGKIDEQDQDAILNYIRNKSIEPPIVPPTPDPDPIPNPIILGPYVFPTKTSDAGIGLIKRFEGFSPNAYKNSGEKYYTIGYGHYGPDVTADMVITREQAEAYLRQDLAEAEADVKRYCSYLPLNQNQFDALVSFAFNLGGEQLAYLVRDNRTLEELPEHMVYYRLDATKKISQGLVNRKNAEVELFNTPVNSSQSVQTTFTPVSVPEKLQRLITEWDGKFWSDAYSRS